jgi:hypothetical protein
VKALGGIELRKFSEQSKHGVSRKGPITSLIKPFATPEEVASLVTYIASPLTSPTTDAALRVEAASWRVESAFQSD